MLGEVVERERDGQATWAPHLEAVVEDPQRDAAAEAIITVQDRVEQRLAHGGLRVLRGRLAGPEQVRRDAGVAAHELEGLIDQRGDRTLDVEAGGDLVGEVGPAHAHAGDAPLRAGQLWHRAEGHQADDGRHRLRADRGDEAEALGGALEGRQQAGLGRLAGEALRQTGHAPAQKDVQGREIEVVEAGAGDGAALEAERGGGDEAHRGDMVARPGARGPPTAAITRRRIACARRRRARRAGSRGSASASPGRARRRCGPGSGRGRVSRRSPPPGPSSPSRRRGRSRGA